MRYARINIAKFTVVVVTALMVATVVFSLVGPESLGIAFILFFVLAVYAVLVAVTVINILQYRERRRVIEGGVDAEAVVLRLNEMTLSVGKTRSQKRAQVRLALEVKSPMHEPYEAEAVEFLHILQLPMALPGAVLRVKVNPRKPEEVVALEIAEPAAPDPERKFKYHYTKKIFLDRDPGTEIGYLYPLSYLVKKAVYLFLVLVLAVGIVVFVASSDIEIDRGQAGEACSPITSRGAG